MLHPLGTRLVICPLCTARTPAPLLFYVCAGCGLYLVYSSTLSMVVCAVCGVIHPPILGVTTARPAAPLTTPIGALRPLEIGVTRPIPRLPPRRVSWLPSTPVRPVVGGRPPQMARVGRRPRPRSLHEGPTSATPVEHAVRLDMDAAPRPTPQSLTLQRPRGPQVDDAEEEGVKGE